MTVATNGIEVPTVSGYAAAPAGVSNEVTIIAFTGTSAGHTLAGNCIQLMLWATQDVYVRIDPAIHDTAGVAAATDIPLAKNTWLTIPQKNVTAVYALRQSTSGNLTVVEIN